MPELAQAESGCLLVADITGYTSYLQATELEHAQDVLADLLETLVETLQPIFILSKLEGDAAFAYAPEGRVSPTLILDTVEAGYFAFRRRLRDIEHASNCDCNACVLIPSLDLKYFIHHGAYVARRIAGTEELTGSDVVLVHRLMKAEAGAKLDTAGFAVYTKTTLLHLGMNPDLLGFRSLTERLADVGDIDVYAQDLTTLWAFENERHREFVTEDEAFWAGAWEVPVTPEIAWDYVTSPVKRVMWNDEITRFDQQTPGRLSTGTVNHCMHGPNVIIEHVADWRPFDYLTMDYPNPDIGDGGFMRCTYEFTDQGETTKLAFRVGGSSSFDAWWAEHGEMMVQEFGVSVAALREILNQVGAQSI